MSAQRTDMDRLRELVRLHRMGEGSREVCRLLGMSPKTELKYRRALEKAPMLEGSVDDLPELQVLREAVEGALSTPEPRAVMSSVDAWMAQIIEASTRGSSPRRYTTS